jgi:hypothetical protein
MSTVDSNPRIRFNHMELTLPIGTLTPEFRTEVSAFYGEVFGWKVSDVDILKQSGLFLRVDEGQFILLLEHREPMNRPAYDHLGLLVESRAEVDALLGRCEGLAAADSRVEIKTYADLVTPGLVVHAFYVRYLLPIHFDVQCHESRSNAGDG